MRQSLKVAARVPTDKDFVRPRLLYGRFQVWGLGLYSLRPKACGSCSKYGSSPGLPRGLQTSRNLEPPTAQQPNIQGDRLFLEPRATPPKPSDAQTHLHTPSILQASCKPTYVNGVSTCLTNEPPRLGQLLGNLALQSLGSEDRDSG